MASLIRDLAASSPEMLAVFDDAALVRAALAFEAALARAEAAEGLIPTAHAEAIVEACAEPVDIEALAAEAAHAGTLAIPLVARLRETIAREAEGAVEAHDLRTRHAGRATFIEFHLVVPGDLSVRDAHDLCDRVEAGLKAVVPDCLVTIHVEPEHKAKHSGVLVL